MIILFKDFDLSPGALVGLLTTDELVARREGR